MARNSRSVSLKNRAQDTDVTQLTSTPMKKKARTAANRFGNTDLAVPVSGRPRTKRGSLNRIVEDIPLDVALEIFKHLEPLDLLHLSRTSRALRTILMCRGTSRQVWVAARANIVGPPSIPDDMSEPSYASFAFEPICYACRRGPCQYIVWDFRMHCHDSCAPKVFYTQDELKKLKNWSQNISTMIRTLSGTGPRKCLDCIPCLRSDDGYWNARKALGGERGYLPSVIKSLRLEYMEVKDKKERLRQWKHNKAKEYSKRQKVSRPITPES
ncbi:hypothetical protein L218DRAFT_714782 [Marasmius fiardii PR-910]|nr:hypothetical protein L218DRAFT_714782 [Marasmius fiardii PR-910]